MDNSLGLCLCRIRVQVASPAPIQLRSRLVDVVGFRMQRENQARSATGFAMAFIDAIMENDRCDIFLVGRPGPMDYMLRNAIPDRTLWRLGHDLQALGLTLLRGPEAELRVADPPAAPPHSGIGPLARRLTFEFDSRPSDARAGDALLGGWAFCFSRFLSSLITDLSVIAGMSERQSQVLRDGDMWSWSLGVESDQLLEEVNLYLWATWAESAGRVVLAAR